MSQEQKGTVGSIIGWFIGLSVLASVIPCKIAAEPLVLDITLVHIVTFLGYSIGFIIVWSFIRELFQFIGELMGGWNSLTFASLFITALAGIAAVLYYGHVKSREGHLLRVEEQRKERARQQERQRQQRMKIQEKKDAELRRVYETQRLEAEAKKRADQEKKNKKKNSLKEARYGRQRRNEKFFNGIRSVWNKLIGQ